MNADGSQVVRLTRDPYYDLHPVWSPDGKYIAFDQNLNNKAQLFLMDSDGNNIKRLTTDDFNDSTPAWAPNGNEIVFGSDRENHNIVGETPLYTINLSTGIQIPLCKDAYGYAPEWSPDGTLISYFSDTKSIRSSIDRILLYSIKNRESSLLIAGDIGPNNEPGYSYYDPVWSSDGKCILFLQ